MITGVTLINYQERYSTKEYFKKRINKVLVPFLVWSMIGLLYRILIIKNISVEELTLKYFINNLINSGFTTIYWFFPLLLCIYLSIPLFAAIDKQKRKSIFTYVTIVCFVFNILNSFINDVYSLGYNLPIKISIASGYLFYVIVGYLLKEYDFSKKQKIIIYILGLFGLFMHIFGTYKLSFEAGYIVKTFKGYTNVPSVLYSISIFVFAKELVIKY